MRWILLSERLSIFALIFLFVLYSISYMEFIVGASLFKYNTLIALFITALIYKIQCSDKINILFLSFCILFLFISISFYDYSWDGQTYHQAAIISLYKGWNPLYNVEPLYNVDVWSTRPWVEHYPKSNWILASNIYLLTDFIETGKVINFLYLLIAIGFLSTFFTKIILLNKFDIFLYTIIIILSPIPVVQILTFYVDSSLYFLVISLVSVLFLYNKEKKIKYMHFAIMLSILLSNIKFTGLIYTIVILGIFIIFSLVKSKSIKFKLWYIKYFFITIFLSIVIFGYNPYLTNLLHNKNILYPVLGKNKKDVIGWQIDKKFNNENRIIKLYKSYCSVPTNKRNYPELKIDKSNFYPNTYKNITYDTRINGFGSVFCLIFTLSLIYFIINIKFINWYIFAFSQILLLLTIINPALWWARLVPFFYIYPILMFLSIKNNSKFINIFLKNIILVFLFYNMFNIMFFSFKNSLNYTNRIQQDIKILRKNRLNYVMVDKRKNFTESIVNKLERNNINYQFVKQNQCKQKNIIFNHLILCEKQNETHN